MHRVTGLILALGIPLGAYLLDFCALLAHAWVSVRDVIMDYVRPVAARLPALALLAAGLIAIAAWFTQILLRSRG